MARKDASALHGPKHVRAYLDTDGEYGHDWRKGSSTLLLITKGRRSGEERINALIYGKHGDDLVIVASKGGTPQHPGWYMNLRSEPEAQVQVLGDRFPVRARDATPGERPELWRLMTQEWPDYDAYQQRTDREIPVVVLEKAA
jgi:deazaflavin-dependent oxidoreductase (nitroreductase family)